MAARPLHLGRRDRPPDRLLYEIRQGMAQQSARSSWIGGGGARTARPGQRAVPHTPSYGSRDGPRVPAASRTDTVAGNGPLGAAEWRGRVPVAAELGEEMARD